MKEKRTFIDGGNQDRSRPKNRKPKTSASQELIKRLLRTLQHVSPRLAARIIWGYFTTPGKTKYSPKQLAFIKTGNRFDFQYMGCKIQGYRWGEGGRKVLIAHGWRSKAADFRRMIEFLVEQGFEVYSVDMKAHGQSQGKASALPEFRDILEKVITEHGPFQTIIGYSLGGIAAGMALDRIPVLPEKLFIISSPPYVRYFFKDVVMKDVGCNEQVYDCMAGMVQEFYGEEIDYFDLRKSPFFDKIELHLIYDEDDNVVPMDKGVELLQSHPQANWVQSKGIGHYKIIAHEEVIKYISKNLKAEVRELVG